MSAEFKVKITNEKILKAFDQDIADIAIAGETQIKQLTPVRTGLLKSSIETAKVAPFRAEIKTNVQYAPFVEFGTARQQPRAMFRTGMELIAKRGKELLKNLNSML